MTGHSIRRRRSSAGTRASARSSRSASTPRNHPSASATASGSSGSRTRVSSASNAARASSRVRPCPSVLTAGDALTGLVCSVRAGEAQRVHGRRHVPAVRRVVREPRHADPGGHRLVRGRVDPLRGRDRLPRDQVLRDADGRLDRAPRCRRRPRPSRCVFNLPPLPRPC